jgi:putative ATP-dependent endonuclease of OLD family
VADEWTLEFDLAYVGLAQDVWIAARLAKADERIHEGKTTAASVEEHAKASFDRLVAEGLSKDALAAHVYALFTTGSSVSKATAAQYLASRLERRQKEEHLSPEAWRRLLPAYLCRAIDHVTKEAITAEESSEGETGTGQNGEAVSGG